LAPGKEESLPQFFPALMPTLLADNQHTIDRKRQRVQKPGHPPGGEISFGSQVVALRAGLTVRVSEA
ncbi:MAG: hypothetical protein WAU50_14205, partial [Candidatus Sulfotelmatobacter sp.]